MNIIEIKHLTKTYKDVTAVNDLSLEVGRGELFGLLGVNGAGKTTTIKMLSTLTTPTSGDALIDGHSILHDPEAIKRVIAISPQETAVGENLTVEQNLRMMAGVYSLSREKTDRKVKELSEQLGLTGVMSKRSKKLSGGYKRRLSIAMALISEPRVLFLDEPTLGLDVISRSELWDVIKAVKGDITIILTTHYLEEAEQMCDRLAIMKEGRLVALGTADEIKEKAHETDFEKAFVQLVKGAK